MELAPGTTIGGFLIEETLGRGAMGVVYRARHADGTAVAIKTMVGQDLDDLVARERFKREALAAASVSHPNVVRCLGSGEHGRALWIAFELAPGGSLADRLKQGPLPWREAASLGAQIARALAAIHAAAIVHRDLKPGNVLLDAEGEPRITDFGIARRSVSGHSLTQTGEIVGTPEYVAPEQVDSSKSVDGRADLYSLGIMLHALVTGSPPFRGDTFTVMKAHLKNKPPALRAMVKVPARFEALVARLLEKDPAKRFASGLEVAAELDEIAVSSTGGAVARIVAALLVLSVVAGAAVFFATRSSEKTEMSPEAAPTPPPLVAPPTPAKDAVPKWYYQLSESKRPRLPLPKGVAFGKTGGQYVAAVDSTLELVYVPGGELELGENIEVEPQRGPARKVVVSPFFIGKYEVTIGQFRRYVKQLAGPLPRAKYGYFDRQPLRSPRAGDPNDPKGGTDEPVTLEQVRTYTRFEATDLTWERPYTDKVKPTKADEPDGCPVSQVTAANALAYAAWLGLELPTEAQWEFAAAWDPKTGERVGRYSWGDAVPGKGEVFANLIDQSLIQLAGQSPIFFDYDDGHAVAAPVTALARDHSPSGVFGMTGNLREICRDGWDPDYHRKTAARDPVGENADPDVRVLRGGSWGWHGGTAGGSLTLSSRDPCWYASNVIGLRVAVEAP